MRAKLTVKSSNRKTGPIPVSITESASCPDSCPLRDSGICYAKHGHTGRRIWGSPWPEFCRQVKNLPEGQLWRHDEAGDLPHQKQRIDSCKLDLLVNANRGKSGFTFTHHDMGIPGNREAVRNANQNGFTINLSADSLDEADELIALNIAPVTVVLPAEQLKPLRTPAGNQVAICPNSLNKSIQCIDCKLCANPNRKAIIGFPAHGSGKNRLTELVA